MWWRQGFCDNLPSAMRCDGLHRRAATAVRLRVPLAAPRLQRQHCAAAAHRVASLDAQVHVSRGEVSVFERCHPTAAAAQCCRCKRGAASGKRTRTTVAARLCSPSHRIVDCRLSQGHCLHKLVEFGIELDKLCCHVCPQSQKLVLHLLSVFLLQCMWAFQIHAC